MAGSSRGPQPDEQEPLFTASAFKEQYRSQLKGSIGGSSGVVITAVPTVVFVTVNARYGLKTAAITAVGSAVGLALYRLVRREPLQHAASGLFGVVIAALIASRTGEAKGFFLLGIWTSFVYAGVLLLTVLLRRPFAGLLWEFVDPTPGTAGALHALADAEDDDTAEDDSLEADAALATEAGQRSAPFDAVKESLAPAWYRVEPLYRAYQIATLAFVAVFGVRGIVQATLFQHDATGWLAIAKIGLGLPPYLAAIAFAVWIVRRTRQRLITSA